MKFVRKTLGNIVARGMGLGMTLVYQTWILPLWAKIILVLVFVSALSELLLMAHVFVIDRGTLVGVLTLQTGFAAYLVSVSKTEHVERLIPVVRQIFSVLDGDTEELKDFVESTSFVTLQLPQRLAVYVLISDILICPFVLFQLAYVQVWIMTMTLICMVWLLFSVLLLRVELFAKWLSAQMDKLQKFFKKHGQNVWILLLFIGLLFAASNWLKKQSESKTGNAKKTQPNSAPQSVS